MDKNRGDLTFCIACVLYVQVITDYHSQSISHGARINYYHRYSSSMTQKKLRTLMKKRVRVAQW